MREALRLQSPRAGRLRSRLISICTSKAPRARSLSPLRASLATCLQGATMKRLPSVICFCCSSCWSACATAPTAGTRTLPSDCGFSGYVAARVEAGHLDGQMLTYVGGALHQSKIPASPELANASARQHVNDREGWPVPDDVHAALAGLLEACGDDPFMLVGSLVEFSHAMPAENRGALAAGLALCGASATRGAAVLLLLDPDRVVRRAVAEALATVASALSPTEVRRLVAMRNWRPENERAEVDGIVRKARAAGVDCAQWEAGSTETILATAI